MASTSMALTEAFMMGVERRQGLGICFACRCTTGLLHWLNS